MSKTTSSKFRVTCKCGKKYLVRSDLEGRKVRCRNCNEELELKRRVAKKEPIWCPVCFSKLDRKDPVCKSCNRKNEEYGPAPKIPEKTPGTLSLIAASLINLLPQNPVQRSWIIVCSLIVIVISILQIWCSGPVFILLFFCLGVGLAITCICARMTSQFTTGRALIGILTYEAVGLIRLAYGFTHDMHRFGLLVMMMFLGPLILLCVASIGSGGSADWSSNYHSCSSCGSSCGGGCGGGGCGGCGGD